jgi:uncharacterized protein (TIGR02246 family)
MESNIFYEEGGRRMRRLYFPLFLISLSVLFIFCTHRRSSRGEAVTKSESKTDVASDIAEIKKLEGLYDSSINNGNLDLWISLWTDDGISMPPNTPAVIGKKQIKAGIQSEFELYYTKIACSIEEIRVARDWAFVRGTYKQSITPKVGSKTIKMNGKYISVYERQVDGSWKLARDCFNYNAPPIME